MKLLAVVLILLVGACAQSEEPKNAPVLTADAGSCDDNDGDGYGEYCELGGDCDDTDDSIHTGCSRCAFPQQGCPCAGDARPVSCYLTPSAGDEGTMMCHEGTRYCRAGSWSGCESVVTYPRQVEPVEQQALVGTDAGSQRCTACAVTCFVVRDNLNPVDAGLSSVSSNITSPDSGGLTLKFTLPDASSVPDSGTTIDNKNCVLNTAPDKDCDGILDDYDPYPYQKPFETTNPAIYLDVKPGTTGVGNVNLQFYLNSADVYFLMDQTGSMAGEQAQLKKDLLTGDFIADASYDCSDSNSDGVPDNYLKTGGIVGAVRCIIREANFGVGYFREIPFKPAADVDNITFRNLQDITSSLPLVTTGVANLFTVGNIDWPEDDTLGLYQLATGSGFYFGTTRPGVLPRTDCPAGTFGYPCFRSNAVPIVLMFTDAPLHNGPPNNTQAYVNSTLGITKGTNGMYTSVPPTNETYANAYDLGNVTTTLNTYIGDTSTMKADFPAGAVACAGTDISAPDAVYKFTLTATKTVTATTDGTDFDTTLAIFPGLPATPSALASYPNTNDNNTAPYDFGNINNKYVQAAGDSSSTTITSDLSANDVSCGAAAGAKDATFTFRIPQDGKVSLDTSGSSYGTSIALFSSPPAKATTTTIALNNNDTTASALAVGSANGLNRIYNGNTNIAGINANYLGNQFACAAANVPADASPDVVYNFSLASAARVRLSTEESAFPVVMTLTDNGYAYPIPAALNNSNELEASARDLGVVDDNAYTVTGNTASMNADYLGTVTGCNTGDTSKDAVFKFKLNSQRNVQLDTFNSGYDTILSLFRNNITPAVIDTSTRSNEIGTSAFDFGSINGRAYTTVNASTTGMVADYNATQICTSGVNATSPEAVYHFKVDTATRVGIYITGATFDTVASLHTSLYDPTVTAISPNTNDTVATAYAVAPTVAAPHQSFTGTTSSLNADIAIDSCAASQSAKDAVVQLNIATAGSYDISTIGSTGFDTVLGLFPSTVYNPSPPATVTPVATPSSGANGDTKSTAYDIGVLDNKWVSYSGTTVGALSNFTSASTAPFWLTYACSATTSAPDVYYKFTLASARSLVIDTIGSAAAFDTTLTLMNASDVGQSCDNDTGGSLKSRITTSTLAAGTYYVILKGKGAAAAANQGAYTITFRDAALATTTNLLQCDDNSGGGTTSKITRTLAVGTYNVVIKGLGASDQGTYRLNVKYNDVTNLTTNRVACNNGTGYNSTIAPTAALAAGDYYIVVKGSTAGLAGDYTLAVQDLTTPLLASCNDNATGSKQSLINTTLPAGTYYAVLKSYKATAAVPTPVSGAYQFNIKDTSLALTTSLQCDYNSGPSGSALIEKDLAAGTYRVFLKGKAATDKGNYKLNIRDLTTVPTNRVACDHNAGASGASRIDADLTAGTYTVVLKGDTVNGAGSYKLSVRDATRVSANDTSSYCNDDANSRTTSTLSQSLPAGTYYAVVKGKKSTEKGIYQLTLGGGTATTGSFFVPPTWSEILAELTKRKMRVMTVLSCQDDSSHGNLLNGLGDCDIARTQSKQLATSTGALGGGDLSPLVFDIDGDGGGLSKSVVDGIIQLANYLEMNVSARVVFDPDPNPGFGLQVVAVDAAGDGCSGLVGAEHQRCRPGAAPKFEVRFTNPLNNPVPLNPKDPKGGYNFRAELIGDSQFVLDAVPIYVVPQDIAVNNAPVPIVAPSGNYWQDITAGSCSGTTRPDWHDLTWSASVPNGTTVTFGACASDNPNDLKTCAPKPIVTITGGRSCKVDSECAPGYCSTEKNCQTITGNSCTTDKDCYTGTSCLSNKCTYKGQPVYAGFALGTGNYTSNLRLNIGLTGNITTNSSPTVRDWSLTYNCNSAL